MPYGHVRDLFDYHLNARAHAHFVFLAGVGGCVPWGRGRGHNHRDDRNVNIIQQATSNARERLIGWRIPEGGKTKKKKKAITRL